MGKKPRNTTRGSEVDAAPPSKKLDLHLQQQAQRGTGTERVIVRTRSGKRNEVAGKLRDRGHRVYADHAGIDAFSVELPVGALEALANDPSVASISTDADVDSLESKKNSRRYNFKFQIS